MKKRAEEMKERQLTLSGSVCLMLLRDSVTCEVTRIYRDILETFYVDTFDE